MKITKEKNLHLAKELFVDLIYNSAKIEGCNVTFPQTQTILDGAVINNISLDDIQTVLNLRDAYRYMLNNIDLPLDLKYICKINAFISKSESLAWGCLRTGKIGVSGTDYIPKIPTEEEVIKNLIKINNISNPIEKALEYFCYAVKSQLFWDGNKRTSIAILNKILIKNGQGLLLITEDKLVMFNETLLEYYNTNDNDPLKEFLNSCIKI